MNRNSEIIQKIRELLDLLESTPTDKVSGRNQKINETESFSGPAGGIKLLVRDGFFKQPKPLSEVVNQLKQEGFLYPQATIAVALLRSVRGRQLVRIQNDKANGKEWVYAERK